MRYRSFTGDDVEEWMKYPQDYRAFADEIWEAVEKIVKRYPMIPEFQIVSACAAAASIVSDRTLNRPTEESICDSSDLYRDVAQELLEHGDDAVRALLFLIVGLACGRMCGDVEIKKEDFA